MKIRQSDSSRRGGAWNLTRGMRGVVKQKCLISIPLNWIMEKRARYKIRYSLQQKPQLVPIIPTMLGIADILAKDIEADWILPVLY